MAHHLISVPIDLVGFNEAEVRACLLDCVLGGRAKPDDVPFLGQNLPSLSVFLYGKRK